MWCHIIRSARQRNVTWPVFYPLYYTKKDSTLLWRIFFDKKYIWRRVPNAAARLDKDTSRDQLSTKRRKRIEYLLYHWKGIRFSCDEFLREETYDIALSPPPLHRLSKGMSRDQVCTRHYMTSHYPHYQSIRQRHVTWHARYAIPSSTKKQFYSIPLRKFAEESNHFYSI